VQFLNEAAFAQEPLDFTQNEAAKFSGHIASLPAAAKLF
jgi:hypothetical protein